jgi:hypothetical protein
MPKSRTAKRAAGSSTPLEGKALAIAVAMVQPTPMKGEPTLSSPEPRTPEQGAAGPPLTRPFDRLYWNALRPVRAWPRIRLWTSLVPS